MSQNEIWEEEDWFPEETKKAVKQTSAIFDPEYSVALSNVINQLDPASFARMARTCKTMCSFCFHSKDIRVSFNNFKVYIESLENGFSTRFVNSKGKAMKVFDSAAKRIFVGEKYPFVFNIGKLTVMRTLDEGLISSIRLFLEELPVKKISEISTDLPADWLSWNGFLRILNDYRTDSVSIFRFDGGYEPFPEDVASQLLKSNLKKFCCDFSMPEELVFETTIPHWELTGTRISIETFGTLVLKCAEATYDIFWVFGCPQLEFHPQNIFKTLSFHHDGPIPDDRPLVVLGEKYKSDFWILRRDSKVVHCFDDDDLFRFTSFDDPDCQPKCLRSSDLPPSLDALVFVPTARNPSPGVIVNTRR